jgi:predicted aldo/keto reductase-like oxidoreductase
MKYRRFGSTGFQVSALGLGCMRLPTQRLRIQKINVPEAIELIRTAVDKGINYVDTALPYHLGESERVVGRALSGGYRERVHLVTKLPLVLVRKPDDVDRILDRQLARLRTDHVDTYLFHSLNPAGFDKIKRLDLMRGMLNAREDGRIRYVGFSSHSILPAFKEFVDFFPWDVVQIQYNYVDTAIQATTEGLRLAAATGAAVVIMEPVKGGILANPSPEAIRIIRDYPVSRSPVDWALQFLWNLEEVSVVLSGMGSMQMLDENCASADASGVGTLTAAELDTIDELAAAMNRAAGVPCTACRYCMPCPSGVNIPRNLAILNNMRSKPAFYRRWVIRRSYRDLAGSTEQLDADRSNGNATLCTECGACLPKCPQSIDIPRELARVEAAVRGHRGR